MYGVKGCAAIQLQGNRFRFFVQKICALHRRKTRKSKRYKKQKMEADSSLRFVVNLPKKAG